MKKLLVLPFILTSLMTWAQTEEEIETIADGTCKCLNNKSNELKNATATELQMELGICMLGAMNAEGIDVDLSNPNSMTDIGEKVGFQMAFSCPDFMTMIGQMMEDDPELMNEMMDDEMPDFYFEYDESKGSVVSVNSDEFVSLKLNSESGRKETYYWFEFFVGSDLLENDGVGIIGKRVNIEYEEVEIYSPKLEDYTDIRVIRSITLE